jgi:hypothetical protein
MFDYLVPGYFAAMDIPILRGRGIVESDRSGKRRVAVINETMANLHWPDANPIGQPPSSRPTRGSHDSWIG